MRVVPLLIAVFAVVGLSGCASSTGTPNPSAGNVWRCPEGPDNRWPESDHAHLDAQLIPGSPESGIECAYAGSDGRVALVGSAKRLSAGEISEYAARINSLPPMWAMRCPANPGGQQSFAKYLFDYADGTRVVIEDGRGTCPRSVSNGKRTRAAIAMPEAVTSTPGTGGR